VQVKRAVLWFVDSVLFTPISTPVLQSNLYWLVFTITAIAFIAHTSDMRAREHAYDDNRGGLNRDRFLLEKFKAERNWWLNLLALGSWLVLYRLRGMLHTIADLEEKLHEACGGKAAADAVSPRVPATPIPTAPPAPAPAVAVGGSGAGRIGGAASPPSSAGSDGGYGSKVGADGLRNRFSGSAAPGGDTDAAAGGTAPGAGGSGRKVE